MRALLCRLLPAMAFIVLALSAVKPAAATTIDYTVTFGASDFDLSPPVGFVLGQYEISLDPSADASGPATIDFLNLNMGPLSFTYSASLDRLIIADDGVMTGNIDDQYLWIDNFSTGGTFFRFLYSQAGDPNVYLSLNGAVHISASPAAVTPVPAALPLFISALGGLGYFGWRRNRGRAA